MLSSTKWTTLCGVVWCGAYILPTFHAPHWFHHPPVRPWRPCLSFMRCWLGESKIISLSGGRARAPSSVVSRVRPRTSWDWEHIAKPFLHFYLWSYVKILITPVSVIRSSDRLNKYTKIKIHRTKHMHARVHALTHIFANIASTYT